MRGGVALLVIVQISKIIILGFPTEAGSDTWMSILLLFLSVIPVMLLYARMVHLMPGKSLFEMIESTLGRPVSIVLCVLYAYYFLTLSAMACGNDVEFIHLVSLRNTTFVTISIALFVVCAYLANSGSETMGKWASLILGFSLIVLAIMFIFSASKIKMDNLMPLLDAGWPAITSSSLHLLIQPFGEAIMLMASIGDLEKKVNPYKLFLIGSVISIGLCFAIYIQNCAMLGQSNLDTVYFTSYKAASVINIGTIGTRIEAMVAFAFIVMGITKVALCLLAGTKAVCSVFAVKEHWTMVHCVGFLTVALSTFVFHNIIEMFEYFDTVNFYCAPVFQIFIPLVIWVAAEVKMKKKKVNVSAVWKESPQSV